MIDVRIDNEKDNLVARAVSSVNNYIYWKTLKEDPGGRTWAEMHARRCINEALTACNGCVDMLMFNASRNLGCSSIHLMIIENFIMEEQRLNGKEND